MRKFAWIAALALSLAACGGETYPLPSTEAFSQLSMVGSPEGTSALTAIHHMSVSVDSLPDDSSVSWSFSRDGADLGKIIARVDPDGADKSVITTDYVEGSAPDEGTNKNARALIQGGMRQLVEENIRAHFEHRPFNHELRKSIQLTALQTNMGAMMNDVSKSMDEAAANFDARDQERESRAATNPNNATKPSIDLEHKN